MHFFRARSTRFESRGALGSRRNSVSRSPRFRQYRISSPRPELGSTFFSANWARNQACRASITGWLCSWWKRSRSSGVGARFSPSPPLQERAAQAFQHELALLGKVGRHLHKAPPGMSVTVSQEDFQFLGQLGQVARQGITHLNRRREPLSPLGQHAGEVLSRMLPPREEQRDAPPLAGGHNPAGEQSRPLLRARLFVLLRARRAR